MLTGRPPFVAASHQETLRQVQNDDPISPSRLRPSLPADLETICLKCLERNHQALQHRDRSGRRLATVPGRQADRCPANQRNRAGVALVPAKSSPRVRPASPRPHSDDSFFPWAPPRRPGSSAEQRDQIKESLLKVQASGQRSAPGVDAGARATFRFTDRTRLRGQVQPSARPAIRQP